MKFKKTLTLLAGLLTALIILILLTQSNDEYQAINIQTPAPQRKWSRRTPQSHQDIYSKPSTIGELLFSSFAR